MSGKTIFSRYSECDSGSVIFALSECCNLRAAAKKPLFTIGSLQRHLKLEAFTVWLEGWLEGEGMGDKIAQLTKTIMPLVPLQASAKHMSRRDLGRLEPTPSSQHRAQELEACVI